MTDDRTEQQKRETYDNWVSRGAAWDANADRMQKLARGLNQPLIEAAGIRAGQHVLDLASGAGEPAMSIAELVGPDGSVTATDLVPEMLAGARRRVAEAGIGNVAFEIADMEALPFTDASFDVVTCRFGLMFLPEPEKAMSEAFRVLRPGGRAAFMIWGPRDDTTLFRVFAEAGEAVFGADPRIDFDRPFRLGEDGRLAALLSAGGFGNVSEEALKLTPRMPAGSRFWEPQRDMTFGQCLAGADEAQATALDAAIEAGFEGYRQGDELRLTVHARIGTGDKPD
ncbi:MAG: class I SAM-dependent methyltransferase [Chlorobiales bacterium]|nr:class I SAM-dependent methyltransferase [Chlorobiales bacterium]